MSVLTGRHRWSDDDRFIQRHALGLTLAALLILQTAYAVWSGAYVFGKEQPFGKAVDAWTQEFWVWWSWEYNVSLVADTFGVFLIVMLSKWLSEQKSSEG